MLNFLMQNICPNMTQITIDIDVTNIISKIKKPIFLLIFNQILSYIFTRIYFLIIYDLMLLSQI